ncbi:MAG: hypothetical protein AABX88_02185 [Nanoarchaeota archaeon]
MENLRVPSDDVIDILSGIFYFFPKDKDRFEYIHDREFRDFLLRKKEKYPALLHELDIQDYSKYARTPRDALEIAIHRMIFWKGHLEAGNNWNPYIITPECIKYFDKEGRQSIEKKGLLHQVKELSKDFQEEFLNKK